MGLKTQPVAPLETIYEESGSFITTPVDIQHQASNYNHNETINGLISARSIPSVHVERQRANGHQQKPPIEVRCRDGSTHYIHSSRTGTIIRNRRKPFNSSSQNLASKTLPNTKYRQVFDSNEQNTQSRRHPLNVTIITISDLAEAGISPTILSSPEDSVTSTTIKSQSNSSIDTTGTVIDYRKASPATVHTVVNDSTQNFRSPFDNQQQQVAANRSQTSTFQVPLTNDENERNVSLKSTHPNLISSSKQANGTVNHATPSNTNISVGSGPRSAFRPFLKPRSFNSHTLPLTPQVPMTMNIRPYNPSQQVIPHSRLYHQPMVPSNLAHVSYQPPSSVDTNKFNSNPPNYSVVSNHPYGQTVSTKINPDGATRVNASIHMNVPNYQQQSAPVLISTNKPIRLPSVLNTSANLGYSPAAVDSTTRWHNVASNSVYDVARLATKFPRIPLHITLPVVTPTHNQKLVIKHDFALEKRLLNAGLSPETIALYERILDVAENRHMSMLSSPQVNVNQYPLRPFI